MTTKMELIKDILNDMEYDESIRNGIWKHKTDTYQEFFHHAHGDMLPDDFRYKMIHDILSDMSSYDNIDEIDSFELCDSNVPIYNHELLQWVSSHGSRSSYVDDAVSEFGYPIDEGLINALQMGYFMELEEVYGLIMEWINDNVEEE